MKKHLIAIGIILVLSISIFCGCNEINNDEVPEANIYPSIISDFLILEHYGGDSLEYDNIGVYLVINGTEFNYIFNDFIMLSDDGTNDTDGYFEFGERIYINNEKISEQARIEMDIIDLKTQKSIKQSG